MQILYNVKTDDRDLYNGITDRKARSLSLMSLD